MVSLDVKLLEEDKLLVEFNILLIAIFSTASPFVKGACAVIAVVFKQAKSIPIYFQIFFIFFDRS